MDTQITRDIVIIGGGASGTLIAWNLATKHGLSCTVIDPSDRPACGLAYTTPSLQNLLNVPVKGMSADPCDPSHFLRWIHTNISNNIGPETFVPRAIYGLYLRNLYSMAAPEHLRDTVVNCRYEGECYAITLASGHTLKARRVVLACGHFDPARLPGIDPTLDSTSGYHHNAWHHQLLSGLKPHDTVLLIGTGLTTIDVLLRLRESGHQGVITAISRRGLFPERHADYTPLPAPLFTKDTVHHTARAYLHAFHAALKAGTEWRAAIDSMRPVINSLWLALPETEKTRFVRHLMRRWEILRHRMAPQIGKILDQERKNGTLQIVAGHVTSVTKCRGELSVSAISSDQTFSTTAQRVINCTGPSLKYNKVSSPLLHSLLETGEISSGFLGSGLKCSTNGALIRQDGTITHGLYTVGPARLGVLFESIAIPEIRVQAQEMANTLAASLPPGGLLP